MKGQFTFTASHWNNITRAAKNVFLQINQKSSEMLT